MNGELQVRIVCTYVANSGGERNTVVSSEGPSLTTGSRHTCNDTARHGKDDEHSHSNRRRSAASCIVEDGQEWPAIS